jgi:hypothetical protein
LDLEVGLWLNVNDGAVTFVAVDHVIAVVVILVILLAIPLVAPLATFLLVDLLEAIVVRTIQETVPSAMILSLTTTHHPVRRVLLRKTVKHF